VSNKFKEANIQQAVILCGGLGTRLRPLTNSIPKPMVKVNNIPFIHYLLVQMSDQGIKDFILLTGYLGKNLREYYGDGSKWGWNIEYSQGPVEWDTGKRIWEAKDKIAKNFLLLYSDNFATFNLRKILHLHNKNRNDLTLSVSKKEKGNIEIQPDGHILTYDSNRKKPNLTHVEIGYMVVNKDRILSLFRKSEVNFSEIIASAVKQMQVGGLFVKDGYRSISDPSRLKITEDFLRPNKIILIDRDGVINYRAPKGEYVKDWGGFKFIQKTIDAMHYLSKKGFKFIVISNQAGIARGMIDLLNLEEITANMIARLDQDGIKVLKCYICPHHWEDGCDCRKPNTALFQQASCDFSFRLDQSLFIGDDSRDCQAAYNANCKSIFIGAESELTDLRKEQLPIGSYSDLMKALPAIESFYSKNEKQ
jgi:histidinol-phosphate phosphatase family protein